MEEQQWDWRLGEKCFCQCKGLTHGMCVEFIWLGNRVIFSVQNPEVKNGVVICAWQKLRAFPWGPMPPCWPRGSLLLQHPLTLWDHTSTPAAAVAHPSNAKTGGWSVHFFAWGLLFISSFWICVKLPTWGRCLEKLRRSAEAGKSSARSRICSKQQCNYSLVLKLIRGSCVAQTGPTGRDQSSVWGKEDPY